MTDFLILLPVVLLFVVVPAFGFLRGEGADPDKLGTGDRFLRILSIGLLGVITLCFGVCGGLGLLGGLAMLADGHHRQLDAYDALFLIPGGVSLLIAAATGFALYRALHPVRPRAPDDSETPS